MATRSTIVVSAAVIERDGSFLLTRRLPGVHLEGHWEFPGGKCEPGESLEGCLARELGEELDVRAEIGAELLSTRHAYDDRLVELHFFSCRIVGTPAPLQGQEMRWVPRRELESLPFPPADVDVVRLLSRQGAR